MTFEYNDHSYQIKRYPPTSNRSLKPWNAADELALQYISDTALEEQSVTLINDRFGFLATVLHPLKPLSVVDYKSHKTSIQENHLLNSIVFEEEQIYSPLDELPATQTGYIKIPKSLDEFEFYLSKLHDSVTENGTILCGFMTRYFSPALLEISSKYFKSVEQTKAHKKARLLVLKEKKTIGSQSFINIIEFKNKVFSQYPGVFSSGHIDFATQFLLEHISVQETDPAVLDLASGNGVIAGEIKDQIQSGEIHLLDDSLLAIESSKLNIKDAHFHWNDSLDVFSDHFFDLIITNPPFHFEYENNIEVSLGLFKQVHRVLKPNGRFLIVANKHLNYQTHLIKIYGSCSILKENDRFVIYECLKADY